MSKGIGWIGQGGNSDNSPFTSGETIAARHVLCHFAIAGQIPEWAKNISQVNHGGKSCYSSTIPERKNDAAATERVWLIYCQLQAIGQSISPKMEGSFDTPLVKKVFASFHLGPMDVLYPKFSFSCGTAYVSARFIYAKLAAYWAQKLIPAVTA